MFCPICGKENADGVQFCSFCGGKLNAQASMEVGAVPPPVVESKKKSKTGLIVGIIVLVVALLAGLGVLGVATFRNLKEKQEMVALLEKAEQYIEMEKYRKAVAQYQEMLDIQPDNETAVQGMTEAYVSWAESLLAEGDVDGAIEVLEQADERADEQKIADMLDYAQLMKESVPEDWTDADLIFEGSSSVEVPKGNAFIVRESGCYITEYVGGISEKHTGTITTARGLGLGMSIDDYLALYNVKPDYAVWEIYSGEENELTTFHYYDGQDPAEMYEQGNNVWLDLGFHKVDGTWEMLTDYEVRDVWFCDAPLGDYGEVIVFAVNLDPNGEVIGLSLEHFEYDEGWVDWQGWSEAGAYSEVTEPTGVATGHITCTIPEGFALQEGSDILYYSPDYPDDRSNINIVETVDDPMGINFNAEEYKEMIENTYLTQYGYEVDLNIKEFQELKLDDYDALFIWSTYTLEGVDIQQMQFVVTINDITSTLTCTQSADVDWTEKFLNCILSVEAIYE